MVKALTAPKPPQADPPSPADLPGLHRRVAESRIRLGRLTRSGGGGVALLYAMRALDELKPASDDQRVGISIVRRALEQPVREIAHNAGVDGSIVVGKLVGQQDIDYGFDAQSLQYVNLIDAGIVDPTKVVRLALQDAASIAGLLITTEVMVAGRSKDQSEPALE